MKTLVTLLFVGLATGTAPGETVLTELSSASYALLQGKRVVFPDYDGKSAKVYVYDLDSKTRTAVAPSAQGGSAYWIYFAVSGDHLFYTPHTAKAEYPVNYLNLATGSKKTLVAGSDYREVLSAGDDRVMWVDYRHKTTADKNGEIYMYDLSAGKETRLTNDTYYQSSPFTDGVHLVYEDYRKGNIANIYYKSLPNGNPTAVDESNTHQGNPRVHGDWIVWEDYRNAKSDTTNSDIYAFQISTKKVKVLSAAVRFQGNPFLHGGVVIWEDYRNAGSDAKNGDIYAYDLNAEKEWPVVQKAGWQGNPVLENDKVVWVGSDGGKLKLYYGSLQIPTNFIVTSAPKRGAQSGGVFVPGASGRSYRPDGRVLLPHQAGEVK